MFFRLYCVSTVCLRYDSNTWMALVCLPMGTASLKPQHLQTMTLITQHKPIERLTNMVSWPKHLKFKLGWMVFTWKTCMGSAWLRRMFMHGGVPAPVMIKRTPILHHPWRSEQYGAVVSCRISKSKSDLVAHDLGSWGVRLLHGVLAAVFPVKI